MSRQFRGTLCALMRCRAPEASAVSASGMTTAAPPRGNATHYIEMSPAAAAVGANRTASHKYTTTFRDDAEPPPPPAAAASPPEVEND